MRLVWVKGRFACACSACATTRPGRGPDSRAASLGRDGWSWWHQDQCIITVGEHHERVDWLAGKREEVRLLTAERVPQKASCLSSDTRMEWPASRNGISWGGKPQDLEPDLRGASSGKGTHPVPSGGKEPCEDHSPVRPVSMPCCLRCAKPCCHSQRCSNNACSLHLLPNLPRRIHVRVPRSVRDPDAGLDGLAVRQPRALPRF